MAVSFASGGLSTQTAAAGTRTAAVTPTAAWQGVICVIVQSTAVDRVTSVTYGSAPMTRAHFVAGSAAGEPGAVYFYFLGSNLPAGNQTVTMTSTTDTYIFSVVGIAAAGDTTVTATAGASLPAATANPSLSITPSSQSVVSYGIVSGLAAPVTTVEAGTTHVVGVDFGALSGMIARKVHTSGATTIGYTAAADDVTHAAIAVGEVGGGTPAAAVMRRVGKRTY